MNTPLPPVSAVSSATGPDGRGCVVVGLDVALATPVLVVDCFVALPLPDEQAAPTSAAQLTIIEARTHTRTTPRTRRFVLI
jgi:hypothetical protein